MIDQNSQDQATTQDSTPAQDQADQQGADKEVNVEELVSKAIEDVKEKFKTEISGLNRRNSELEKELKKKDLEKLTEKERAQAELEIAREEKKRIEQEAAQIVRMRNIDKALFDAGLSPDFSKRIVGDDEDSIKEDVKKLKDFISIEVAKGVELARTQNAGSNSRAFSSVAKPMDLATFTNLSAKEQAAHMANGGTLTE